MKTWRVVYITKDGDRITDTEICDSIERAIQLCDDFLDNAYITDAWIE